LPPLRSPSWLRASTLRAIQMNGLHAKIAYSESRRPYKHSLSTLMRRELTEGSSLQSRAEDGRRAASERSISLSRPLLFRSAYLCTRAILMTSADSRVSSTSSKFVTKSKVRVPDSDPLGGRRSLEVAVVPHFEREQCPELLAIVAAPVEVIVDQPLDPARIEESLACYPLRRQD